jgi:protoporphyrinogen oxidase
MAGHGSPGRRLVVAGAGVAGLTLAERMVRQGWQVTVLEREGSPGGLCRSFRYGRFTFDIGPHRLHTYDDRVQRYFEKVLAGELHEIPRKSAVYMFGRTIPWPLSPVAALRIPLLVQLRILRDLYRLQPAQGDTFEDYVLSRYGSTLYQTFFKPYTERFTGTPCRELDSTWAQTSIQRAMIDRGLNSLSLRSMVRSALGSRRRMRMYYPVRGGIERFPARLVERIDGEGGTIRTGEAVTGLTVAAGKVSAVRTAEGSYPCDTLVWTAPVTTLCAMLGASTPGLPFLGLVLYNLQVAGPPRTRYQWCYYSDPDLPFSRASVPALFHHATAPPDGHGLCLELPMLPGDPRWQDPEPMIRPVVAAADRVGLVPSRSAVTAVQVERVPEAYPLYTTGYRDRIAAAREVAAAVGNLYLLGRSAGFWYNNIDGSVAAAMTLAGRIGVAGA